MRSRNTHLYNLQNETLTQFNDIGSKAESLVKLSHFSQKGEREFHIPRFICIKYSLFENVLQSKLSRLKELLSHIQKPADIENISQKIYQIITQIKIQKSDIKYIQQNVIDTFGTDSLVAIRSSAACEDLGSHSFAGQFDSFLFIHVHQIELYIKKCWASLFSQRALQYRMAYGFELFTTQMAVIIQEMIHAEKSGVLFTQDPQNPFVSRNCIAASYGVGEGVVQNIAESDTYYFNYADKHIEETIVNKQTMVTYNSSQNIGTVSSKVSPSKQKISVLSKQEIETISNIGLYLESHYHCPLDIEWCIDEQNKIYLTQARPITTLQEGQENVWDNSNIVESFPGVSSPLTFSFAKKTYYHAIKNTLKNLSVSEQKIKDAEIILQNLLGYLDGKIYYNINNWFRLYSLLPGYSFTSQAFAQMIGLKDSATLSENNNFFSDVFEKSKISLSLLYNFLKITSLMKNFEKKFEYQKKLFQEMSFDSSDIQTSFLFFENLSKSLFSSWWPALINDIYTMISFKLLQIFLQKHDISEQVIHGLLTHTKMVDSVQPLASLIDIVEAIKKDTLLFDLFVSKDISVLIKEIHENPNFLWLSKKIQTHIDLHGDRVLQELKLEFQGFGSDRTPLYELIKKYIISDNTYISLYLSDTKQANTAESDILIKIHNPVQNKIFSTLLRITRMAVGQRERMRLFRTKAFGMVKVIFVSIGEKLYKKGVLVSAKDIYFLTIDEIEHYIYGTSVNNNLMDLINIRKKDFQLFQKNTNPDRIRTKGIPYLNNLRQYDPVTHKKKETLEDNTLIGIGCCHGKVKATARVIENPDFSETKNIHDSILVARMTDPGWVFLMASSRGLIIEKGSVLSHSAIIGRELGIPTIVGVADATKIIKDGSLIEMNGQAGTVKILS